MDTEGFGIAGHDIGIGADILVRASLSDEFASASGKYYDNDSRSFSLPHSDALDRNKAEIIIGVIETIIEKQGIAI